MSVRLNVSSVGCKPFKAQLAQFGKQMQGDKSIPAIHGTKCGTVLGCGHQAPCIYLAGQCGSRAKSLISACGRGHRDLYVAAMPITVHPRTVRSWSHIRLGAAIGGAPKSTAACQWGGCFGSGRVTPVGMRAQNRTGGFPFAQCTILNQEGHASAAA